AAGCWRKGRSPPRARLPPAAAMPAFLARSSRPRASSPSSALHWRPALRLRSKAAKRSSISIWSGFRRALCRRGLFVDATQEPPIAEEIARLDLAHGELARLEKRVERKIGVKADEPGQGREQLLDDAHDAVFAGEVIDDDDRAARPADAAHLGGKARRVGHHRGDIERQ